MPKGVRYHLFRFFTRLAEGTVLRRPAGMIRQSGLFDDEDYLSRYPEVRQTGIDPLCHYLLYGRHQGRNPGFDLEQFFVIRQDNVRRSVILTLIAALFSSGRDIIAIRPLKDLAAKLHGSPEIQVREKEKDDACDTAEVYRAYEPPQSHPDYREEKVRNIPPGDIRLIAFYLPQFHPFAENDQWWGKGFTEWTNTSKALPLYEGHYQPRLPGELGFYDTRLKETLKRQMEMARRHGISGFCLHHYFFDGKPLMRVPFDLIMQNRDLDLPFCLHWANEPWTAKFDGYTDRGGVLMAQNHHPEDDLLFFKDIEAALHDPRYIRVNGRPLLIVYRPGLFPDFKETVQRWRQCAERSGLEGLYIAMVETIFEGLLDPATYGVDAVVEFPPHFIRHINAAGRVNLFDRGFKGEIYSYPDVVEGEIERKNPGYTLFRGIFPQWDNTARRRDPKIFHGAEPDLYGKWLRHIIRYTRESLPPGERMIFINAWNEWAEAAYLEPDRRYGYAYLNETSAALAEV